MTYGIVIINAQIVKSGGKMSVVLIVIARSAVKDVTTNIHQHQQF